MNSFTLDLVESELKIILEAITELEQKMSCICETSNNEDEIAEVGNDLIEVRMLLKSIEEKAVKKYGKNVINFSREVL